MTAKNVVVAKAVLLTIAGATVETASLATVSLLVIVATAVLIAMAKVRAVSTVTAARVATVMTVAPSEAAKVAARSVTGAAPLAATVARAANLHLQVLRFTASAPKNRRKKSKKYWTKPHSKPAWPKSRLAKIPTLTRLGSSVCSPSRPKRGANAKVASSAKAHVVQELVSNHRELVLGVYVTEAFNDEALIEQINEAEIKLNVLTDEQMKKISSTVTTQGIVAVARIASKKPVYESSRSVITLVDAVQDPGNLGTLFRTSLGFGSDGMILGRGTVSPFNPKVVRGSSGTFLRVPFEFGVDLVDQINFLRSKGYTIIATDLHAKQSLRQIPQNKLRKMAFLVGNEGAGTNPYFIELADETVKIPMSSELESLNVAVAHGILSYEAAQIQEELK